MLSWSMGHCEDLINSPNDLLVFVGEQIDIYEFEIATNADTISLDLGFKAKYKILDTVFGEYNQGEVIEFNAFDHYGFPEFARFKTVLLFVSEGEHAIYHQKYQYYDVYKTADGRWATCGNPYEYEDMVESKEPVAITFDPSVTHDVSLMSGIFAKQEYPEPTFVIDDKGAHCVMGVYVDELFDIKRQTTLKERGLFD